MTVENISYWLSNASIIKVTLDSPSAHSQALMRALRHCPQPLDEKTSWLSRVLGTHASQIRKQKATASSSDSSWTSVFLCPTAIPLSTAQCWHLPALQDLSQPHMGQAAENSVFCPATMELRLVLCGVFWEDIRSISVPDVKMERQITERISSNSV